MRFLLSCLLLFASLSSARAQNIEDLPLDDTPAIALPAATPTPKPTAAPTATPAPTPAKTRAPQPAKPQSAKPPQAKAQPAPKPSATLKPVAPSGTPLPTPTPKTPPASTLNALPIPTPNAPPSAAPNAEDIPIEDEPLADETPAPLAGASNSAAPNATSNAAAPNKAAPIANVAKPRSLTPHEKQYGHEHDAHHEDATENSDGETFGDAPQNWFDVRATFASEWMRRALVAGILAALLCGFLGVYVVLRRVVFVGVALAELSSAGIALGVLLGFAPVAGALAFMTAGVALFSLRFAPRRVPHESIVGVAFLLASALAVLLIARSAQGETFMLKLMQGDVLLTDAATVRDLAIAALAVGAAHAVFGKEFVLVSFDREAAATLGLRAGLWDFFLMATIGAAIAFSIGAVGVLLTSALLVLPAATALLLARSMKTAFWLAPLFAVVPVVLGLHLSFVADYPASAVIVVLLCAGFVATLVARRGQ